MIKKTCLFFSTPANPAHDRLYDGEFFFFIHNSWYEVSINVRTLYTCQSSDCSHEVIEIFQCSLEPVIHLHIKLAFRLQIL